MSSRYDKIIKNIVQSIRDSDKRGTSPYDTTAEVLRVDGDTAWVHIAGGVDETPVKKTIDCKAGDVVQLRVGGGRAWITGNATAPPTDDTKAKEADNNAKTANKNAIRAIKTAEAEADGRKLLIRQVADGIEVGYENGSYKAFINAEGSFDVINAAGETVASFGSDVAIKSAREIVDDEMGNGYYSQNFMNIKAGGIQLKQVVSGSIEPKDNGTFISDITGQGIAPTGGNTFTLADGVYGEGGTHLWYTGDNVEDGSLTNEDDGDSLFIAGWVTGSKKELMFTIPLCAPIANGWEIDKGTSFAESTLGLSITVRQNNNYLLGSGSEGADIPRNATEWNNIELLPCASGISVHYYSTTAFPNATNNDACGIKVGYNFKLVKTPDSSEEMM